MSDKYKLTLGDLTENPIHNKFTNTEQENLQNLLREEINEEEQDALKIISRVSKSEFEKNILNAMKMNKDDFLVIGLQKAKIAEFDKKMKRIKKIKSRSYRKHLKIARKKIDSEIEIPDYLTKIVDEKKKDKVFYDDSLNDKLGKKIEIDISEETESTDSECMLMKDEENHESEHIKSFQKEKEAIIERDNNSLKQTIEVLPGWGSWGGTGIETKINKVNCIKIDKTEKITKRKDFGLNRVIINENTLQNNIKINLPYGFNKSEYESWLNVPVSRESYSKKIFNKFISDTKNVENKKYTVQKLEYKSKYELDL